MSLTKKNQEDVKLYCCRCDELIVSGEERFSYVRNGPDDFDRDVVCESCWFKLTPIEQ